MYRLQHLQVLKINIKFHNCISLVHFNGPEWAALMQSRCSQQMKCSACTQQAAPMGQDFWVLGAHVGDDDNVGLCCGEHRVDLSCWHKEIQWVTNKWNHGCQTAKQSHLVELISVTRSPWRSSMKVWGFILSILKPPCMWTCSWPFMDLTASHKIT